MTGMLANVSAARGWSIFTPMISSIAGMLDHLGPLGFIRRKNMDLGWGDDLAAVLERDYAESCQSIIEKHAPAIEWKDSWRQERSERQAGKFSFLELFKRSTYGGNEKIMYETLLVRDGFFISPYADILPDGAKEAHFRCIIPLKPGMELPSDNDGIGLGGVEWDGKLVVHFPATGDEGYSMRTAFYAAPLASQSGVASILLSMAYYGKRRPTSWANKVNGPATFQTFSQVVKMSQSVIDEGVALLHWLKSPRSSGGLALEGQGGSMSAAVASMTKEEVSCVPCLAAHGAQGAWSQGVLRHTIDLKALCNAPHLPECARQKLPQGIPTSPSNSKEAANLISAILDAFCNLLNYSSPLSTQSCILVYARNDLFVPPSSTESLANYWQGCETRIIEGGHVTTFVLAHAPFRKAIMDSFDKPRSIRGCRSPMGK